jgi:hypothetical protein
MPTFQITDEDRRAIRFAQSHRKTMCTRDEARRFLQDAVDKALRDLRYRWHGPQVSEAVLNGADPDGLATYTTPADDDEPIPPRALSRV